VERLLDAHVLRGPDGLDRGLHGDLVGGAGDDLGRPARRFHQLVGGDDLGREADLVGPLGAHPLVAAEERQPHDLADGHALQHEPGFVDARHAVGDVRVEDGRVGRDDELHSPRM
jgi:hypothetical protein